MKKYSQPIEQFALSPKARAGVSMLTLPNLHRRQEHDIAHPHRDNHYLLMLATHGYVKLNLDFQEVAFSGPTLLCVFPEQVHQVLEIHHPQGWILAFDPLLVEQPLQGVLEDRLNGPVLLEASSAFLQQMTTLMNLMEQIHSATADTYSNQSLHALLQALLYLIAGRLHPVKSESKRVPRRGEVIEQDFQQLLKQHYKTWKQPAQYASHLAITVAHLNDTVKAITGEPVSKLIQQRSVLEAKRLLYFTDSSVKEIGYELGYNEPVYFGRLFKKITRLTPLQFRLKFRD